MRTVVNTFPVADAGGGAPTVQDDCVTLTPVVVRPRRRHAATDATGPLGVGEAKTASARESAAPPTKRAKLLLDAKTSFSAYASDAADAESVLEQRRATRWASISAISAPAPRRK